MTFSGLKSGLLIFTLLANSAQADTLNGRVVTIGDGDTLTVLDGNRQLSPDLRGLLQALILVT